MPKFSDELAKLLTDYMNSWKPACTTFKLLLESTEPDVRFALLTTVRNTKTHDTGITTAAYIHDVEGLKSMLEGLTPKQKYDVLKITNGYFATPLLSAAWDKGCYDTSFSAVEVVDYLLSGLSAELQFDVLKMQNTGGNSVIHVAVRFNKPLVVQRILADLSWGQKERLLNIMNNKETTAADKAVPILCQAVQDIERNNQRLAALEMSNADLKERNVALERERNEMAQVIKEMSEQIQHLTAQVHGSKVEEKSGESTAKE